MMINFLKNLFLKCFTIICIFYLFGCHQRHNETVEEHPVYSKEIAPIIYRNCTPCHRPGSGAPFDLITYEDVKKRLHTIQLSINERLMPPWPADTGYSHFRDEKVLTKEELRLFNKWVENGADIGNVKEIPPAPDFKNGSNFGKPDMVLKIREPFLIKGDNRDNFIMLKIPFDLPRDTFIRAIEIIPGNKKLVHHINAHLVQYENGKKKNNYDGDLFIDTEKHDKQDAFKLLSLQNDDGTYPMLTPSVTNYLPGVETSFYPEGIGGFKVKKRCALLLDNIHYGPSAVDTSDQTTFNIFFSSSPPRRPLKEFILGTSGISPVDPPLIIPADSIRKFKTAYKLTQDISLVTINPHMHLLGSSFKAYILSGNDTIPLINIPKWDFRWQYFYTFRKIIKVSAGSIIVAEGVYDNTENNPLIPFHPPKVVSEREGSMRTTDEMFQLICTYLPYQPGDENISLEMKKEN
jgi:hypothetical protein